ncbi:thioredoxin family protein [Paracoccus nototheniae]|uniref:Thioredoxin family protein n=1 Tax=Paracoccus nototheniae TaxID=2489002 RepID=A0ABW4DVC3_9RHOB|nr:thioredoxin family protein [Paracoccus nototheniae]
MAVSPPVCDFGASWHDFLLPDGAGRMHGRDMIAGPNGTLIMFICNHCPYVRAIMDRILRDAHDLMDQGIGVVAISANDADSYPEDGPEHMARLAKAKGFRFPYLHDADQTVARAYGAECTPDFFGYNADGQLQYRGRLDASGRTAGPPGARRELFEAMMQIARTGAGPRDQVASMGCSIKWKAA